MSERRWLLLGVLLTAFFGMSLALIGWHLYTDHQVWHALLEELAKQRAALPK